MKTFLRKITGVLALFTILFALNAPMSVSAQESENRGAPEAQSENTDGINYSNHEYNFTLNIPSGWIFRNFPDVFFFRPSQNDDVTFTVSPQGEGSELFDFKDPDSSEIILVDGKKATKEVWNDSGAISVKIFLIEDLPFTWDHDHFLHFSYTADDPNGEKTVNQILESFQYWRYE